jgi:hypothetical protein
MFSLILNKNIIESEGEKFLVRSFKINDNFQCILQCSNNFLCSIAILSFSVCNIYYKMKLNQTNVFDLNGSIIYIKTNDYDQLNEYLIHYWPFNGNYFDKISNANLFNGKNAFLVTDRFGKSSSSLYLNYGYLQAPSGIYLYTDFTLTTWVKIHNLEYNRKFFRFSRVNDSEGILFSLTYQPDSGPYYSYNGLKYQANKALTIGKWQHLAYTLSGSNLKIYINGVVIYNGITTPIEVENHLDVYIGLHAMSHLPKAEFDDIMIFNKSLTQNQISRLLF